MQRPVVCRRTGTRLDLSHAPWHKATDPYVWIAIFVWIAFNPLIDRPDHRPPSLVRLGNDGIVWHIDPDHVFGIGRFRNADAVMAVLGFPIRVLDNIAVRHRTTGTVAAFQLVEPRLEWRVRIPST